MKCRECPEYAACVKAFDLKKRRPHCPIAQSGKPGSSSSEKLMCNLFYCDHVGERLCCRECKRYDRCVNKCLNHPERCGAGTYKISGKPKGKIYSLN